MNRRFKLVFVTSSAVLVGLLLLGSVLGKSASPDDPYRHLAVFSEVLMKIKTDYVEEPNMKTVTLGAVNGLLESIDPYASYLNADQYQSYLKMKDEHEAGVGLILSKRFGYVGVIDSIPGSAAAKAGLGTGDMIETIKGVFTRDMPLAYADLLLRGDPGSTIQITVLRARREPDPQKITLTRAVLNYPAVSTKLLPDGIGEVKAPALEPGKVKAVAASILDLEKQGANKIVLDLRDDASGSPDEGIALANLFVKKGLLGYLQGQRVARKDFNADPAKAVCSLPVAVITNRGTAGGAEVAAAALLDSKRAEVVGERTYGDASVRKTVTMDDGSAIILSVAKYYSPSGISIQDLGVTPSVQVAEDLSTAQEFDEDGNPVESPNPSGEQKKPGDDPLLKKAVEVLTKGLQAVNSPGGSGEGSTQGPNMRPLNIPGNNKVAQ